MTLAEIRTRIEDRVDDSIDSNRLDRWINDKYHEIERNNNGYWKWLEVRDNTTLSTVADQSEYTLPTDFSIMVSVTIGGVEQTYSSYENVTDTGTSVAYTITPDNLSLVLMQAPTTTGNAIDMVYFKKLTELTSDGDEPIFADKFHNILVEAVLADYYERQLDYGKATYHMRKFKNVLSNMVGYYARGAMKDQNRMKGIFENFDESNA